MELVAQQKRKIPSIHFTLFVLMREPRLAGTREGEGEVRKGNRKYLSRKLLKAKAHLPELMGIGMDNGACLSHFCFHGSSRESSNEEAQYRVTQEPGEAR